MTYFSVSELIPRVSECIYDSKKQVQTTAIDTLTEACGNRLTFLHIHTYIYIFRMSNFFCAVPIVYSCDIERRHPPVGPAAGERHRTPRRVHQDSGNTYIHTCIFSGTITTCITIYVGYTRTVYWRPPSLPMWTPPCWPSSRRCWGSRSKADPR